jgi:hypothetical protein
MFSLFSITSDINIESIENELLHRFLVLGTGSKIKYKTENIKPNTYLCGNPIFEKTMLQMLTSVLFNEDGLHLYIGKDSTESVTCKPKTTTLLTKN